MPWILAVALVLGASLVQQEEAPLSVADGEALNAALTEIVQNIAIATTTASADADTDDADHDQPRTVVVSERSVNGYLRFQGAPLLPAGVGDLHVRMAGEGRVTASATVNLDTLRDQQERGALDPLRYLRGTVPVTAVAVVQSGDRTIAFHVESVHVGTVPVPPAVLLEIVRHYTQSDRHPDGIDLSNAFRLPHGIKAVRVEERQTVVVQ